MVKYKLIYDKNKCTGALSCVGVNADLWKPTSDGKVELAGSKEVRPGIFELVIEEKDYPKNRNTPRICPPGAIKIEQVQ